MEFLSLCVFCFFFINKFIKSPPFYAAVKILFIFPMTYFLDLQIVILYWSQIQGSNFLAEIMIKQQSKKLSERKCNLKSLKV